jgi:hypothetical protein
MPIKAEKPVVRKNRPDTLKQIDQLIADQITLGDRGQPYIFEREAEPLHRSPDRAIAQPQVMLIEEPVLQAGQRDVRLGLNPVERAPSPAPA